MDRETVGTMAALYVNPPKGEEIPSSNGNDPSPVLFTYTSYDSITPTTSSASLSAVKRRNKASRMREVEIADHPRCQEDHHVVVVEPIAEPHDFETNPTHLKLFSSMYWKIS